MKILKDTREKKGWDFWLYEDVESITSIKLDAGDYTTNLLDGLVVIERKATAAELANNLGNLKSRARMYREFDRMKSFKKAYIVCEFSETDVLNFPRGSGISSAYTKSIKIKGPFLRELIANIEKDYQNIEVVFCGDAYEAENFACNAFKKWEDYYAN